MFDGVQDELGFWTSRMREHASVVYNAIVDDRGSREELYALDGELGGLAPFDRDGFARLARIAIEVKKRILIALDGGRWLGWLYPSHLEHMIRQEEYALARVSGYAPPSLEVRTWLRVLSEHARLLAHLTDPSERDGVSQLMFRARKLELIDAEIARSSHASLVGQALRRSRELGAYVGGLRPTRPRSAIPPLLLEHVGEEIRWGVRVIEREAPIGSDRTTGGEP